MRIALLICALLLGSAVIAAEPGGGESPAVPAPASALPPAASPTPAPPVHAPAPAQPIIEHGHFDLSRAEIQAFIDQLVSQGLDRNQVTAVLGAAEAQPKIIE